MFILKNLVNPAQLTCSNQNQTSYLRRLRT